jgi:hypothetical protein
VRRRPAVALRPDHPAGSAPGDDRFVHARGDAALASSSPLRSFEYPLATLGVPPRPGSAVTVDELPTVVRATDEKRRPHTHSSSSRQPRSATRPDIAEIEAKPSSRAARQTSGPPGHRATGPPGHRAWMLRRESHATVPAPTRRIVPEERARHRRSRDRSGSRPPRDDRREDREVATNPTATSCLRERKVRFHGRAVGSARFGEGPSPSRRIEVRRVLCILVDATSSLLERRAR